MSYNNHSYTFETFIKNCTRWQRWMPEAFAVIEYSTPEQQYAIFELTKKLSLRIPGLGAQSALELLYSLARKKYKTTCNSPKSQSCSPS